MTDLMKLTKLRLSVSLSSITIPTSIRLTTTNYLALRSICMTFSSSSLLQRYSFCSFSVGQAQALRVVSTLNAHYFTVSQHSSRKVELFSLSSMKMLPPWQSAWMKLFFISISKKVDEPSLAMALLRGCLLRSQQVTGTPSTKVSTNTMSLVLSAKGKGKLMSHLSLNISLNLLRFSISQVKSI